VFDRSRKTLFGEAEGIDSKDSLPKFQPQPGGFGRRQTPVGDLVGQPLTNMKAGTSILTSVSPPMKLWAPLRRN